MTQTHAVNYRYVFEETYGHAPKHDISKWSDAQFVEAMDHMELQLRAQDGDTEASAALVNIAQAQEEMAQRDSEAVRKQQARNRTAKFEKDSCVMRQAMMAATQ